MKHFCNHRGVLIAVLFTFAIIQQIDGHPPPWTYFLSYDVKKPLTEVPSHNISVYSAVTDVTREATTSTSEFTTFHNLKPLMAYIESRNVTRFIKISEQKEAISGKGTNTDMTKPVAQMRHDNDEEIDDEDEGLVKENPDADKQNVTDVNKQDVEPYEKHDKRNEELDSEIDDNTETNTKVINLDVKMYVANHTKDNDNDILIGEAFKEKVPNSTIQNGGNEGPENVDDDGLIFEAIKDNIFWTPEEFELAKNNEDSKDENMDFKKYETHTLQTPNAIVTQTNLGDNEGRTVIADPVRTTYMDDFTRLPVPSCNGSTFCENLPYYPSDELVENALRINYIEPLSDPSTITQRMGPSEPDGSREESLCFSEKKEIKPASGLDENKEWHYIINNAKYEQKIEIELCLNESGSCRLIDPPATGYKTFCKQKYVYRHLVTISPNGTAASKSIRMPSSCCCHVKFSSANIASRMGGGLRKNNQGGSKLSLLPGSDND